MWQISSSIAQKRCKEIHIKVFFLLLLLSPLFSFPLSAKEEIADVVEKVTQAIVNIRTEEVEEEEKEGFFERIIKKKTEEEISENLGSGVVIDPQGLVVTNEHLVSKGINIEVRFVNGEVREAYVIATNPDLDLALLKIKSKKTFPYLKLERKKIRIGQRVIVIGNPYGLSSSVTQGIISAVGRNLRIEGRSYTNLIQTDASVNPGNSGGALLDLDGSLVGIVTAIYGEGKGIGFAIPVDELIEMVEEFKIERKSRPFLGIIYEKRRDIMGFYLSVKEVIEGSPAAKAGIKKGDRIIKVNNHSIHEGTKIQMLLKKTRKEENCKLKILRKDKTYEILIESEELFNFKPLACDRIFLGIETEEIRAYQRLKYRIKRGVEGLVVKKILKDRFSREDFQIGDVILSINNEQVKTKKELQNHLFESFKRNYALFQIKRGKRQLIVPFKFDLFL